MTYLRPGLGALSLTVALAAPSAFAQEGPGLRGTLTFDTGLEVSDNPNLSVDPEGTSVISRTNLGFGILSETRTETFRFNIGTSLTGELGSFEGDGDDDDFGLRNTTASVSYTREGSNSSLSFSGRYSRLNLDDTTIFIAADEDDFDPDAIEVDGGVRENWSVGAVLETGIEGPLEFRLSTSYSETNYVGTSDPDLDDSDTIDIDALTRFRITPAFTARALAGFSRTNEDDADNTLRENRYVGVGLETETRGGLTITSDLLFDESETTTDTTSTTEDGVGFDLALRQDRPAGSIGFVFSSRIDESGRRTSARVDRQFDLPDGGLGLSIGVLDQEDDELRLTGSLNYARDTPRGGLQASLTQTPVTSDGNAFLNTNLSVSYREEINASSSWSAALTHNASNELGGSDDDSRTSASVSYSRELTRDWALTTGFRHTRFDDSETGDGSSNTVFFNIGRDITFGF